MTVSPPARSSRASVAMKRSVLCIHSISGEFQASTLISRGSSRDEMLRGRMVEAHDAADHDRRRAASAVAEDLVPVADLLARQVEQLRRRHARRRWPAGVPRHAAPARDRPAAAGSASRAIDLEPALAAR